MSTINPTLIHSSAGSKNLSSFLNSVLHFADEKESTSVTATQGTTRTNSQPATKEANSLEEQNPADHEPGETDGIDNYLAQTHWKHTGLFSGVLVIYCLQAKAELELIIVFRVLLLLLDVDNTLYYVQNT